MSDTKGEALRFLAATIAEGNSAGIVSVIAANVLQGKAIITSTGEVFAEMPLHPLIGELKDEVVQELCHGTAYGFDRKWGEGESSVTLVCELIRPRPSLVIFGAGHVGQAVARIGSLVGYCVTVVDDRKEFLSSSKLPDRGVELIGSDFETAAEALSPGFNTAVVIVTRGHQHDETCLKGVIYSNARYVGMIGSRRRILSIFKKLSTEGIPMELLDRVKAPIGLSIGAKSPQEIAVAIMAEVIQAMNSPLRNEVV